MFERKLRVWQPLAKFLVNDKLVILFRVHCIVRFRVSQSAEHCFKTTLCFHRSYSPLFESLDCALKFCCNTYLLIICDFVATYLIALNIKGCWFMLSIGILAAEVAWQSLQRRKRSEEKKRYHRWFYPNQAGSPQKASLEYRYPPTHDNSAQDPTVEKRNLEALSKEREKSKPRKEIVLPLMKSCFFSRRQYVMNDAQSVNSWILDTFTQRVWAPPLMEVLLYSASNAVMRSK